MFGFQIGFPPHPQYYSLTIFPGGELSCPNERVDGNIICLPEVMIRQHSKSNVDQTRTCCSTGNGRRHGGHRSTELMDNRTICQPSCPIETQESRLRDLTKADINGFIFSRQTLYLSNETLG
ncbi:hypothetical protein Bbelb_437700 [Branchiostoma belcheri]|nr:hypothetical protein Bbelb_445590 [Branchiostoma belcheri]KAI8478505.1 hypothetical protein Bbelb_437700 [Branchiostoma belcheri]